MSFQVASLNLLRLLHYAFCSAESSRNVLLPRIVASAKQCLRLQHLFCMADALPLSLPRHTLPPCNSYPLCHGNANLVHFTLSLSLAAAVVADVVVLNSSQALASLVAVVLHQVGNPPTETLTPARCRSALPYR